MVEFDWPDRTALACLLESLDAAGMDGAGPGVAGVADDGAPAPVGAPAAPARYADEA